MSSPTLTIGRDRRRAARRARAPRASGRPRRRRTGPPARREHRSARPGGPCGDPCYHRRPPCQSASPRTGTTTVVSVLREAARVNGDVEAYVEPAGPARRAAASPSPSGTAPPTASPGDLARRGVGQGDVVVPPAAVVDRLRRAVRRPAAAGRHHLGHQSPHGRRARWPPSSSGPRPCSPWSTPRPPCPARRWRWSTRAEVAGLGGRPLRQRGPTCRRTTRWPWSGPAARRASPRVRSSTTPTWPRWPMAPTC